jgi:HEAT repeat protein
MLLSVLQGSREDLMQAAATSLIEIGNARTANALLRILATSASEEARYWAVYVLGFMHASPDIAAQPLITILANQGETPRLRGQAAESLAYVCSYSAHPTEVETTLLTSLEDASAEVRYWSAFALGQIADLSVVPALERIAAADSSSAPFGSTVGEEARDAVRAIRGRVGAG